MEKKLEYMGSVHCHTDYSNFRLRDSINKVNDLIGYAVELGHKLIGITEHETVASSVEAYECWERIHKTNPDFKVILGNEIYLVRDGLNAENFVKDVDRYYHFILLAKDAIGHKQIRELSTRAWMRSYKQGRMIRVPTYYSDLIEIIGKNPGHVIASSACFRKGTQVETKNGWKNIEEIKKGDFVINRYGEWEEVIEPTSMLTHQYGYSIELTGSEKPLVCTDNHEFLVITSNSKIPRWVQAKDLNLKTGGIKHIGLEPTNFTYIQNKIIDKEEWDNSFFNKTNFSHRKINLPEKILLTPELMRLFGLFLGNGCISLKANPCISFSFNEKEYDNYMNSFVKEASKQLNITWSVNRIPKNHKVEISSCSRDLIDLFYWLFGGVNGVTKRVPNRLRVSKELDYELVFGYLLADGYFRTRTNQGKVTGYSYGEFTSTSISKGLSYDIYRILNQLNITSSIIKTPKRVDKNGTVHQEAWYVTGTNKALGRIDKLHSYSPEDVIKLFEEAIAIKEKDFITIDNIRYRKIRFKKATKIELNERVYCLNNTTHSFKCENIIVHNCLGGALPTQLLRWRKDKDAVFYDKILNWVDNIEKIFGKGNFFLEMQPSETDEQLFVNNELLKLSKLKDIPYIITTDAHYKNKEMRAIHKAYLNSQDGDREVDDFYATTYLMNTEEIESYMLEPLGQEALQESYRNLMKIYDMCEMFDLRQPLRIPILPWREVEELEDEEFYLEKMPYLNNFKNSKYKEDNYLVKAVINGIRNHKDLQNDAAYEELNNCLKDTWISSEKNNARWSAYFLNLQKTIDYCWEAGTIVGPGRGSGVGFLLLYCLDIIQINSLREKTKTFRFRFLNPDRASVLDVDTDISGLKRAQVLSHLRNKYGSDRVANVLTLGTEKSRSAIQTAARGLGLDVDIARYLSSMIEEDRGEMRTLKQTFYGDEDKGFAPNKQFVYEMTNNYPELWEVAQAIEGLICRVGVHAGGLIFVDEPFTEKGALMKSPNGDIITQFELHTSEKLSMIKIDLLSVEALDRIQTCLELLQEYGKVEGNNIREIYEKVIGIYNLERESEDMWKMLENHEVNALFQMEGQTGIQGIETLKPHSVDDLAILNSTIRLMPQNKGDEMPTDKCARFKASKQNWIRETELYGLTDKERDVIWPILETSYGMCITQEQFMQLVQLEECGGFDLMFADRLRKAVARFLAF